MSISTLKHLINLIRILPQVSPLGPCLRAIGPLVFYFHNLQAYYSSNDTEKDSK